MTVDGLLRRLWKANVSAGELKERALRRLMPARMRFVHYSWPLRPDICPCDVHFCDFLQERNIRQRSIFHFGTGGHHLVGVRNSAAELDNDILGLTVSPNEHARYVKRVIRNPMLAKTYKVLFADLYSLNAACLPMFDIVTLFHLGEHSAASDAERRSGDAGILQLFCSRLVPGGLMFFYPRSFGHARLLPLLEQTVADNQLSFVEEYKSLALFRVPGGSPG